MTPRISPVTFCARPTSTPATEAESTFQGRAADRGRVVARLVTGADGRQVDVAHEGTLLNEVLGNCETNRPFTLEFNDQWYFLYHTGTLPGGDSHHRPVCIDHLYYDPDGAMPTVVMTSRGLSRIREHPTEGDRPGSRRPCGTG